MTSVIEKPKISITANTFIDLGLVYSEQHQINVKFVDFNIPLTSDSGYTALNLLGKTRFIVVQGAQDGSGYSHADPNGRLRQFILEVEAWVNSPVQIARTYYDTFGAPYNVYCADFTWMRSTSDPQRVLYTFLLKRA
jgi:hypothetical protein